MHDSHGLCYIMNINSLLNTAAANQRRSRALRIVVGWLAWPWGSGGELRDRGAAPPAVPAHVRSCPADRLAGQVFDRWDGHFEDRDRKKKITSGPGGTEIEAGETFELKRVAARRRLMARLSWPTLPGRNENARIRISPCALRTSHFSRAKFIPNFPSMAKNCPRRLRRWRRSVLKGKWKVT